jgi:glycosyltransferase involved in cell wall biosynthesis
MRVASLAPYVPFPPHAGGHLRIANLVGQLARRGIEVDLWCVALPGTRSVPEGVPEGVRVVVRPGRERDRAVQKLRALMAPWYELAWQLCPRTGAEEIEAWFRSGRYDLVLSHTPHFGPYQALARAHRLPVVIDAHDVVSDLTRAIRQETAAHLRVPTRAHMAVDSWWLRRRESAAFRQADCVVAVSPEDEARIRELSGGTRTTVIPSGVDSDAYVWQDHTIPSGRRLLMTGNLGYLPNIDGLHWFLTTVLPEVQRRAPGVHLDIVGGSPTPAIRALAASVPGVQVHADVADVRPFFSAADLFVVPLRCGGGTRLKIVEALATGLPIVTTSVGVAGLPETVKALTRVADTPDAFASAIIAGLGDRAWRACSGRTGRELVERELNWRTLSERYADVMHSVLDAHRTADASGTQAVPEMARSRGDGRSLTFGDDR